MIAPRQRLAESMNPFTTVTPADRIPSHGQQLTVDGTPGPSRHAEPPTFGAPPARTAPATLNLWDQSADSLPETWSTPR